MGNIQISDGGGGGGPKLAIKLVEKRYTHTRCSTINKYLSINFVLFCDIYQHFPACVARMGRNSRWPVLRNNLHRNLCFYIRFL